MDFQTLFYALGSLAMVLFIIVLFAVLYMVFFIKRQVEHTKRAVIGKIVEYTKPVDVLKGISESVIGNILLKLRNNFGIK